ncbi:cellulase [Exilibacterium tricleocarpae]|uniref:Endoglucanase n=1 Tax=Exilibacterium tricleocarpae TaxID=2591008 RepID=A0A545TVH9_9GAMM|nr:glycoside hydrolase family 9 protein [Exilibacterium tricleocarpae]TQV81229.1 cellulase [Exilibacterium tricleocarpae]
MNHRILCLIACPLVVACLAACGGGSSSGADPAAPVGGGVPTAPEQAISLNQIGFYTGGPKIAAVPVPVPVPETAAAAETFALVTLDDKEVFRGDLSVARRWPHAQGRVRLADFSSYTDAGRYRLQVEGLQPSDPFTIADNVHNELNRSALKAFYFNRSGIELTAFYADRWARPAGHPDTAVAVHSSAASVSRPEGTLISAPMGWYDAGDYNKYIVNSGIATFTLLAAYEHFPQYYAAREGAIPESGNSLPDILDEALWNIRWMLSMQDPADGGVYHKLTTLRFSDRVMPHRATAARYVVQKSTAAALNFAAVMAVASRVFADYDAELPGFAATCAEAAERAWQWAQDHPDQPYVQPPDINTGTYAFPGFDDEFAWAAAELYIASNDDSYYTEFTRYRAASGLALGVPSWTRVDTLAYVSLLHHQQHLSGAADIDGLRAALLNLADTLRDGAVTSAYGVAMGGGAGDFVWGSNAVALNQSLVLIQAYRHTRRIDYLHAALANLDYVLGRNALAMSFVTGIGQRSPQHVHHRPSAADNVVEPVPGWLAGGPHAGQQDGCSYPSDLPGASYLDDWCSYSTNEVAINWNAPLVYVSGALEAISW